MSIREVPVTATISIFQFMSAAKQFLNDSNMSKSYWGKVDAEILEELARKIRNLHEPEKKDSQGTCVDSLSFVAPK